MFDFFDTDKSGAIEFGEFTAMLPMLGIQMSDAKAFKYVLRFHASIVDVSNVVC